MTIRAVVAAASHFTGEDFFITLRYAENISRGAGFVYNPGDRVLGTTAPLYALLLAAFSAASLPAVALGKIANIAADGALCIVVYRWLAGLRHERAGILAACLVAVHPVIIRWSISGMETSLVTLCCALVWLAYNEHAYRRAYLTLAVLFLLRWDSALLLAVLIAAHTFRLRRIPWRELIFFLACVAPWLLFATWYFGNPIPVTGAAKMTVYGWRFRGQILPQLGPVARRFFGSPLALALTAGAALGMRQAWRERRDSLVAPAAWFALYWTAFLASKILLFEWYLVPPFPIYLLFAALGLEQLAGRLPASRAWRFAAWPAAIGVAMAVCMGMTVSARETQSYEDNLRIPLGIWLREHTLPGDRILLEPIGYIGYYSRRPILDAVGLVSPEVLQSYTPDTAAPWLRIIDSFRPEWCVLRLGERQHILDGALLQGRAWEREYALVRTVDFAPPGGARESFFVYRRLAPRAARISGPAVPAATRHVGPSSIHKNR